MTLALLAAALAGTAASGAAAPDPCAPDEQLSYVCGTEKPEDVVAMEGTKWLIASGFSTGAGLKLVDTKSRTFEFWYRGTADQIDPDTRAFSRCPGRLDPALFNTRGLSIRRSGQGRWRLLVVNHGGRESIEIFDVAMRSEVPHLTWRGCLPMPEGQVANSVASFSDGTILTTVLTRPGTTIADFVQGRVTGAVWQWRPGDAAFALLPGTELPGNNGLETDPDDRHFHVVAFGWHAVVTFDRVDTTRPVSRIEAPDFIPDNIHWTGGRLLLAGMRLDEPACGGLRRVIDGIADPMTCHRGWIVAELDRAQNRIRTIAYGTPRPAFNGLSAAALVDGALWLGSYQSARLAVVPLP
jgi:hypothetical protein